MSIILQLSEKIYRSLDNGTRTLRFMLPFPMLVSAFVAWLINLILDVEKLMSVNFNHSGTEVQGKLVLTSTLTVICLSQVREKM